MDKYNVIINEERLHEFKPPKNRIHVDILTISENNEMKPGLHVYKLKKHYNNFYYYLELNNSTIIFHDVIADDYPLDDNKANGIVKKGIYGYEVIYSYYEDIRLIGLFDREEDAARLIFELRKHDWHYSYFDEIYYNNNENSKYIKRIFDKYLVYKMGYIIEYYGLYDSIDEAFERIHKLIENNWVVEEKIYSEKYLNEKNKEPKPFQVYYPKIYLKVSKENSVNLYLHAQKDEVKKYINLFNGYMPPKGVHYFNKCEYRLTQRHGYKEYYISNQTLEKQMRKYLGDPLYYI